MLYQFTRFVACALAVLLIAFLETVYPDIKPFTRMVPHFDKYQHFLGGALLMVSFFDTWKKTAKTALLWVFVFNVLWELFELAFFYDWTLSIKWYVDTMSDIVVTTFSAMLIYYYLYHKPPLK